MKKRSKKKIYVGAALTHAPYDFRLKVEKFKDELREKYELIEFFGLRNDAKVRDIFEWDTKCVKTCDLYIPICDYPSIGLGYQIGVALENNKTILAIAKKDATISRYLPAIKRKNFSFKRYKNS